MEARRRPWQRRIEVYSPKIQRRLTLFSRDAHDAWLLLEADPDVRTFCERPAYVAGKAGRLIDFWVDRGRHAKFSILSGAKDEDAGLPATPGALRCATHGNGGRSLNPNYCDPPRIGGAMMSSGGASSRKLGTP
jgi:hypothetical protein